MVPQLVDAFILLSFCGVLFAVAAVGVLSLPWRDEELDETLEAARVGWRVLDQAFQQVSGKTPVEAPPEPSTPAYEPVAVTRVPLK